MSNKSKAWIGLSHEETERVKLLGGRKVEEITADELKEYNTLINYMLNATKGVFRRTVKCE